MAGIIASRMQARPEKGVVGNITPGQAQQDEKVVGNNTPEEQEEAPAGQQDAYDRVMTAFMAVLYDEASMQEIVQSLQAGEPEQAIAMTTINVLVKLDEVSGGKIPSEVLIDAAIEGMELIAELGEKAGFFQFDEAMQARTIQQMIAMAIERGIIDPAEIEELMASMDPAEMQSIVAQQQQLAGGV